MNKLIATVFSTIVLMPIDLQAAPVYFSGTGNYYEYVQDSLSWQEARTASEQREFMTFGGHLVTITSASENDFVASQFSTLSADWAWTGGYEPNDDGVWRWAVGPEAGTQFSLGSVPTSPYNYANWGGIEPNDFAAGEDFMMFYIAPSALFQTGQWADDPANSPAVDGYLVEYETSSVPVPAALQLFVLALATLGVLVNRHRNPIA